MLQQSIERVYAQLVANYSPNRIYRTPSHASGCHRRDLHAELAGKSSPTQNLRRTVRLVSKLTAATMTIKHFRSIRFRTQAATAARVYNGVTHAEKPQQQQQQQLQIDWSSFVSETMRRRSYSVSKPNRPASSRLDITFHY